MTDDTPAESEKPQNVPVKPPPERLPESERPRIIIHNDPKIETKETREK